MLVSKNIIRRSVYDLADYDIPKKINKETHA